MPMSTDTYTPKRSKDTLFEEATRAVLSELSEPLPEASVIRDMILDRVAKLVREANSSERGRDDRLRIPDQLTPLMAAEVIVRMRLFARVDLTPGQANEDDTDTFMLGVFEPEGRHAGLYVEATETVLALGRVLAPALSESQERKLLKAVAAAAPVRHVCSLLHLIAVNNGVFDHQTKKLRPFSPDLVFVAKSRVDYVEDAKNPRIQMEDGAYWDVESWMSDLSDDPEVVHLLWEGLSAAVRPNVKWNRALFLHSTFGNNGKGTYCELMRNVVGRDSTTSIPMDSWGKDFYLGGLIRATVVVSDENNVGSFIDSSSNFKAAVTGDPIMINRKYKDVVAVSFQGLVVQCVNDFLKTKDKSGSYYRRQIFVPFDKNFQGRERTYIKSDFLHRPEVLQYVLRRVLHMNHTKLSEPAACKALLEDYKLNNDPQRLFWSEMRERFVWDQLPAGFVYALYRAWMERENPGGRAVSAKSFGDHMRAILSEDDMWEIPADGRFRARVFANDKREHLLGEYNVMWLEDQRPANSGIKMTPRADTLPPGQYRGYVRRAGAPGPTVMDDED